MEYLQEPSNSLIPNDVEMISFDCIALDKKPQMKTYAQLWRNTFEVAEDIYTLGGQILENKENLDALEEFWKLLFHDKYETKNWKASPLNHLPKTLALA
jgi:predicted rRNA methylase YqxC with S4 and FtsJ domains